MEFTNIHIKDILDFIRADFGVNFVLDDRAVSPERRDSEEESDVSHSSDIFYGPKSDGMIENISLSNLPISQLLTAMLRPLGLAYSVEENFVFVSKPIILARETFQPLETRHQPLGLRRSAPRPRQRTLPRTPLPAPLPKRPRRQQQAVRRPSPWHPTLRQLLLRWRRRRRPPLRGRWILTGWIWRRRRGRIRAWPRWWWM